MAKFSDLISYFENIARTHIEIGHSDREKHFFRMEIDEILSGISRTDVNFPMLALEGYSYRFTDFKSDNILKNRQGAFVLLTHVSDISDYGAVHQQWDFLEEIADDILARIKADKYNRNAPVIRAIDLNDIEVSLIMNEISNTVGLRVLYNLTSPAPLEVNPARWLAENNESSE